MRKAGLIGAGFFLVALLLGGVFYQKVYTPKATFETTQLQKTDFPVWLKGIGELDAQFIYRLGFPVTGRVMELYVDQGDSVNSKQLLAKQDDTELNAALAEVEAIHAKTRLEITSTQREIELNQEQYDLSKLTYDRYQKMIKGGNISQAQFDQAKSSMLTSKISLENAKIKLALSRSEANRVEQSIEVVKAKIHYTQLHTPITGLVVERLVERGQSVAAAQTVLKVLDPDSLWIRAYVDERISGPIKVGQTANIILRSMPNQSFEGTVKRINFQSDSVTQEHVVFVGFDTVPKTFFLNEQAEVAILAETLKNTKSLPIKSFAVYKEQSGVWVNRKSKAYFVPLKVLSTNDNRFAFEGDLLEDDRVLIMQLGKKPLFAGASIKS